MYYRETGMNGVTEGNPIRKAIVIWLIVAATLMMSVIHVSADEAQMSRTKSTDADWVAQQVWQRPDGNYVSKTLVMRLTDPNGKTRERTANIRRWKNAEVKKTRISFTAPKQVKNTRFLTYDYNASAQQDEQWLYLSALKKTRRIPSSDRGDSFMGTVFSYEDVKSELKFPLEDYDFELLASESSHYQLQGIPRNAEIAKELGYGKFVAIINSVTWLPEKIEFWDTRLTPLKQVVVTQVQQINNYWQATELLAKHWQNQHQTSFTYATIEYLQNMSENDFSVRKLVR